MKKQALSLILCLLLLASLALPVSAVSGLPMVVDNAQLLTQEEMITLEDKAQTMRTEYETDIVILTVESPGSKTAQDYADDYFDENGYGYGDAYSGILFLLSMADREWYISTCGDAINAVTDYSIQQLGETAVWYLSEGEYFDAFNEYLDALPYYLKAYQTGAPIDGYADFSDEFYHGAREDVVYYEQKQSPNLFVSLLIGVIAATVVILIMRSSMNTKRQQRSASGYLKAGTFHLRRHQDMFLYSNVSKVRRQQNNTSGGGSSVHRSSGGRHHGGGGGRF